MYIFYNIIIIFKVLSFIIHPCDPTVVICYLIWPCDMTLHITYLISHSSSLSYQTVIKGYFRLVFLAGALRTHAFRAPAVKTSWFWQILSTHLGGLVYKYVIPNVNALLGYCLL